MRLQGKVAIITGAGAGIGRAAAQLFARERARVVVADLDHGGGQETADLIKSAGGSALFVHTDVSKAADCEHLVQACLTAYGRLDILYCSAGIHRFGTVVTTSEETWDQVLAVNLKGTFLCCKYAVPAMIAGGGGCIITTTSAVGVNQGAPNVDAYAASKGGVSLLTRCMALDHGKDGIRVNCICPGPTDTPMMHKSYTAEELAAIGSMLPSGRMGKSEDVAAAALWLASEDASWVTGSILTVDGGRTTGIAALGAGNPPRS